jgi:thioredoxin reductase (NADPH)
MSWYLANRIERIPNIDVHLSSEVESLEGPNGVLASVVVRDDQNGSRLALECRALFVFIGAEPHVDWLAEQVTLDERGFILTGIDLEQALEAADGRSRRCGVLETSLPGVFAAGDVRSGSIKRVAAATGEGSMAVWLIHRHLARASIS